MTEQTLDLKRSVLIVRRHLVAVGVVAAIGLVAGGAYSVRNPPLTTSSALVVLPPNANTGTQAVIASSEGVLAAASRVAHTAISLQQLRNRVDVKSLAAGILSINAQGNTAKQAEDLANAIASSYVAYANNGTGTAGKVQAKLLAPAANATGGSRLIRLLIIAFLGALAGAFIGAIGALAAGRRDRRLRQRDEIASAIGIPVLASLPVWHATDARSWTALLNNYELTAVQAWQLGTALRYLGPAGTVSARANAGRSYSLTVLSLSSDRRALALGPQLAVFAAREGIRTALIIGPQQDTNVVANLRAACAASTLSARQKGQLLIAVADHGVPDSQPEASLTVVVAVVDAGNPQVAGMIRTTAAVLGASAGAVTAEQLARVAASAGADGRQIEGIIIADPDPADRTTGRIPRLARPEDWRQPTRLAEGPARSRRMNGGDHPVRVTR